VQGVRVVIARPAGVIRGQVRTKDGELVPDAWVTARRHVDRHAPDEFEGFDPFATSAIRPVLTDRDGRFVFEKLQPARTTSAPRRSAARGAASADGVAIGADVTLEVRALAGLTGVVSDQGAPVAAYSLRVTPHRDGAAGRGDIAGRPGRAACGRGHGPLPRRPPRSRRLRRGDLL